MNDEVYLERLFADRQKELALKFEQLCKRFWYQKGLAFIHSSMLGTDGVTRYGRFRDVSLSELVGRKYRWEHWDGQVTIFWRDVLHDPKNRGNRTVPGSGRA